MDETSINSDVKDDGFLVSDRLNTVEVCIDQLSLPSECRNLKRTIPYLETLTSFIQVLRNENNNYQELLKQIALIMKHESKPVNQLIIRNGDKGSQFYVILSGKIAILTLQPTTYYLNDIEYISYLLKLKRNEENEVIRQCIHQNYVLCPIEDSFDQWMKNLIHSKDNKGGKSVLFEDDEEVIQMVEETRKYIRNKRTENITVSSPITIEKYIYSNQLTNCLNIPEGRKPFEIFNYQLTNQIETGQTFGSVALESKSNKRTATLITLTQTELAVIDKAEYDLLIKTVNDKAKKKFYNIIYSYNIYQDISKAVFEKKYFHLFVYKKKERGEKLIEEGHLTDNVYFTLKGEFELVSKKNMIEVNALIIRLKRMLQSFKYSQLKQCNDALKKEEEVELEEEKENEDLIINKQFRLPEHNKILFEKKQVKIGVIKDRDIIGLIDCVEPKSKIGLITCSCVSHNSEVYSIPQSSFDMINRNESYVKPHLRQYQEAKINYLIKRLLNHKDLIRSEIAKIDNDTTKNQQKENDFNKDRGLKNRLYQLEANSKYNIGRRNIAKPITTNVLPIIMNKLKEKIDNSNQSYTNRYKKNEFLFKTPQNRNRNRQQCLFLHDYQASIIHKNLYNNLFHSYLKTNDILQSDRLITDSLSFNDRNNKSICAKETVSSCKHSNLKSKIKQSVNVIDCLILDKFNKCYSKAIRSIVNKSPKKKVD